MSQKSDIIAALYDALDSEPSSVAFHERLLEVWQELGNEDMSSNIASVLIELDPNNQLAKRYFKGRPSTKPKATSAYPTPKHTHHGNTPVDFSLAEKNLERGYKSLKLEAKLLQEEVEAVYALNGLSPDAEKMISNLQGINDGNISGILSSEQPVSVRETAREIIKTPNRCQDLIVEDYEAIVRWAAFQTPPLRPDAVRERLMKRKVILEAALPPSMQKFSVAALTQVERQYLEKKYINSETMLGDKIEDIPTNNFLVTEDNYAWNMEELAQAIAANDGIMRNPLSRQMFSESDVRMILAHSLGKRLKPLLKEQEELKKGVRPTTIDQVDNLGRIMLADQSSDAAPSRQAIDEFQTYVATLPEAEQKTIHSLKVPARDRTSGQAFDYSIGGSVKDAKANMTCYHKVGDFLSQAATYLRKQ